MPPSEPSPETHLEYLTQALSLARLSPPKPTNFRVGCVLVAYPTPSPKVLSTGYTLELEGNTHAEQNALAKLAAQHGLSVAGPEGEAALNAVLTPDMNVHLYTTMEPCGKRLSGNAACVARIIATRQGNRGGGVRKVVFGAREPGTFVQDSAALRTLDGAGVVWEHVGGLEGEILRVATEGHGTDVDDITPEERERQRAVPRNPKKRMMEVDVSR